MKHLFRICTGIVLLTCLPAPSLFSQVSHDYGFEKTWDVEVKDENGNPFSLAWLGGLNACQFMETDLNMDGLKDLVAFERTGNKLLTFINHGTAGAPDFTYAPRYISKFPALHDWLNLKDYNCDGKEDLFTFDFGGISVYKNVSDTALKFELVVLQLLSYQWSGYINIWVTTADYPVIDDIDGDGDLDIVSFYILGTFVQYHQNMSMEKYGTCDSLDFNMTNNCFGYFVESSADNRISLNIPCPFDQPESFSSGDLPLKKDIEHTGSTMLSLDLNGDGLKDILVGDVTFPGLIALYNGGTPDSAHMVSQDTAFPSNSVPVNIVSFPVPTMADVDNDGQKELLVSPFDPNPNYEQNQQSVWLYKNTGTAANPAYALQRKDFLQGDMIDVGGGACPVFFDYDNDGLTDIILGNFGYLDTSYLQFGNLVCRFRSQLAWLRNTGTAEAPAFRLMSKDIAGISSMNIQGAFPAFGDIDGDGVPEMLLGHEDGTLLLYENTAGPGQPADFVIQQAAYQGIDAGTFSTPQLVDLDRDSLLDLVIGNQNGNLWYYRNTGTKTNPVFTLVTGKLGNVDVRDTTVAWDGYSVPCFFEDSGKYKLFVGCLGGYVSYYKDIEGNLGGDFTLAEQRLLYFDEGDRSAPAVADFNGDSLPDLVIGNLSGGLGYFMGTAPVHNGFFDFYSNLLKIKIFPNPAKASARLILDGIIPNRSCRLKVFDLPGRTVLNIPSFNPGSQSLDLHTLNPGIYVLEVTFQAEVKTGVQVGRVKFIKE